MKTVPSMLAMLTMCGCGGDDAPADAAMDLRVPHDFAVTGHCVDSTPLTVIQEGACALAPANGYCFVDVPQPAF